MKDEDGEEVSGAYNIEKYFSNGDVDRGHTKSGQTDLFGKRNTRVGRHRRYSDDQDDPSG